MELELIKELKELETKLIQNEKLNEKDLVTCKVSFEEITGKKIVNKMLSCGGRVCEIYRRVLVNYLKTVDAELRTHEAIESVKDKKPELNFEEITVKQITSMLERKGIEIPKKKNKTILFDLLIKSLNEK